MGELDRTGRELIGMLPELMIEAKRLRSEVSDLKESLAKCKEAHANAMRERVEAESKLLTVKRTVLLELATVLNFSLSDFPDFDRDD